MAINTKQFRELIIVPTLNYLEFNSEADINLMLGTAAVETDMGTYLRQIGGPALSPYGIERATHRDIQRYLYKTENDGLRKKVFQLISQINQYGDSDTELIFNLRYATAICRIKYLMVPEPLPTADDLGGLANYWKKYYNTAQGKGDINTFIEKYKRYVTEV